MRKQAILTGALTTILVLAFFSPVSANRPSVESFVDSFSWSFPCTGFDVQVDATEEFRITTFVDADDNPTRVHMRIKYDGTVTSLATGQALRDSGDFLLILDPDSATETRVGVPFHITEPGEGIAVLNVGKLIKDADGTILFEAGHYMESDEALDLICQALG